MKMMGASVRVSILSRRNGKALKRGSTMMQVFQEGLLTLQRIRTGGKQTVVVQHVQVSDGGQAVIAGSMKSGRRGSR